MDLLCERWVMVLSRPAADQGIVHTLVQATNSQAVISLLIDFEVGSEKKFRRKLLDCETDRVRSVRKTSVPNWLSPRLPIAGGEKLRLRAVIKSDLRFFRPRMRLSFDNLQQ